MFHHDLMNSIANSNSYVRELQELHFLANIYEVSLPIVANSMTMKFWSVMLANVPIAGCLPKLACHKNPTKTVHLCSYSM